MGRGGFRGGSSVWTRNDLSWKTEELRLDEAAKLRRSVADLRFECDKVLKSLQAKENELVSFNRDLDSMVKGIDLEKCSASSRQVILSFQNNQARSMICSEIAKKHIEILNSVQMMLDKWVVRNRKPALPKAISKSVESDARSRIKEADTASAKFRQAINGLRYSSYSLKWTR